MKKFAASVLICGLMVVPSAFAANGTITKGYGGSGGKVQAVLGAQSAPKKTAVVATTSSLPFTGADLAVLSFAGAALLGMGFGLRKIGRRNEL